MQSSAPYRPSQLNRSQADSASEQSETCPFLGSSTHPGTTVEYASDANKCLSTRLAVPISTIHQENYCLSADYETCPVFRQRSARPAASALLPVAAVGLASADSARSLWAEPTGGTSTSTAIPAATVAAAAAMAASATPQPMTTNSSPLLTWDQTPHPDFQADMAAATARRQPQSRQVNLRPVLLGLLLLALIPLAWWLWTSVRPGPRSAAESVEGTVVTLPTLMATSEPPGPNAGGAGVAPASPETSPVAGGVAVIEPTATPTAEPTLSDLERIAATATALFANATAVTECTAPSWWVAYTVEEGDTIEALATTRGILPEALIVSNCLAGSDLPVGLILMLPPVGVIAFQPETTTPTPTPTPASTAVRPTRGPGLPTRAPIIFPTPTFPVIIILTPQLPTAEPTEPPPTERPVRPTTAATTTVTLTPPSPPFGTVTQTLTPPSPPFGTVTQTLTPPSPPLGTVTPTLTPPAPPTSSP